MVAHTGSPNSWPCFALVADTGTAPEGLGAIWQQEALDIESPLQSGIVIATQQSSPGCAPTPGMHAINGAAVHRSTAINMVNARLLSECIIPSSIPSISMFEPARHRCDSHHSHVIRFRAVRRNGADPSGHLDETEACANGDEMSVPDAVAV